MAVVVIEIDEDHHSIGLRIQSLAIGTKLGRELVEESFPPRIRSLGRTPRQPPLATMTDDRDDMSRQKAWKPSTNQRFLRRTLDQHMQLHRVNLSSK
jgi:hypothetical protein